MAEHTIKLQNEQEAQALFGRHDQHLRRIEKILNVTVVGRGNYLKISGKDGAVDKAVQLFEDLLVVVRSEAPVRVDDLDYALHALDNGEMLTLKGIYQERIEVSSKRRFVVPRTVTQKAYVDSIRALDVVFGIGPAGTGKTYLAMAMAVETLLKGEVSRIILTRPAVEAGERLGYLPGDLAEKINPYLRPLYDALHDMMDGDMVQRYMSRGIIEVAPLAYMRGRTLNDSFIVLDEAQNTTSEQMKMFLTRLGFDSKVVITGDVTQIDLPAGRLSGLVEAQQLLSSTEGIGIVGFTAKDVVRHKLVQEIIRAYDEHDQKCQGGRTEAKSCPPGEKDESPRG